MSFILFFLCGLAGGLLGGMGMGGGSALIPLLALLGVPQLAAQGTNLFAFLPMSAGALAVHAKSGLVCREGLLCLVLPALFCSALFSAAAALLPAALLRRGFGIFLAVLSLFQFSEFFKM